MSEKMSEATSTLESIDSNDKLNVEAIEYNGKTYFFNSIKTRTSIFMFS